MATDWMPEGLPKDLRIGTCGSAWPEWRGTFYPADLPDAARMAWYAQQFATLEANASVNFPLSAERLRNWVSRTPPGFRFSFIAPRSITQARDRGLADATTALFVEATAALGARLGPVVLPVPRYTKAEAYDEYRTGRRLLVVVEKWLEKWRTRCSWVVQTNFTDPMTGPWHRVLSEANLPLALTITPHKPTASQWLERGELPASGALRYVRFLGDPRALAERTDHGVGRSVIGRRRELREWIRVLRELNGDKPIWAYFSNTYTGFAPAAAREFAELWLDAAKGDELI